MDPENVVVKAKTFSLVVNELYPVFRKEKNFVAGIKSSEKTDELIGEKTTERLKKYNSEILVTFKNGNWTIGDFLYHLSYRPFYPDLSDINRFAASLRKNIALMLRDYFLEKEGRKRGYQRRKEVISELNEWHEKYRVAEYINHIKRKSKITQSDVSDYYKANINQNIPFDRIKDKLNYLLTMEKSYQILMKEIDSLKKEMPVKIYSDHLAKIQVDEPRVGRLPDVKLYKLGLPYFREAFPTPDPLWGIQRIMPEKSAVGFTR